MSKFHKREIKKGIYGELSKIEEELQEAYDAQEQGQDLMLLIELSDMIGAIEGVAKKHGMTLDQLKTFAKLRSQVAIEEEKEANSEKVKVQSEQEKPQIDSLEGLVNILLNGTLIEPQFSHFWKYKDAHSWEDVSKAVKSIANKDLFNEADYLMNRLLKMIERKK